MLADSTIIFDGSDHTAHVEQGGPLQAVCGNMCCRMPQTTLSGEPPLVHWTAALNKSVDRVCSRLDDLSHELSECLYNLTEVVQAVRDTLEKRG